MSFIVLNELNKNTDKDNIDKIDQELKKSINNLKGDFYDLETGKVNYQSMKGSESFKEYQNITEKLKYFNLDILDTREKKLSFWINIYNSLVVHGIIQLDVKNTVKEVSGFFEYVSYNIGGYYFSLDQIEHGILRGNIKKHILASRPFSTSDDRTKFVIKELDPRIHFCLVCGSTSCPPIGTYQEERIDKQMDMAATTFINGADIKIDIEKSRIKISKIFKWYKKDFGTDKDLALFLSKYRTNSEDKKFLEEKAGKISISHFDYDWSLNK
jgi:hypothetical protein